HRDRRHDHLPRPERRAARRHGWRALSGSGGALRHTARWRATLAVSAALAAGAALAACTAQPDDEPVSERLKSVTGDAAAAQAVAAMLSAYGGWDVWSTKSTAEYQYVFSLYGGEATPKQVTRQRHHLALRDGMQVTLEDLDAPAARRVVIDGESLA